MLKDEKSISKLVLDKAPLYKKLFSFVNRQIAVFPDYIKGLALTGEDEITSQLCFFFDDLKGDLPYRFQNQSPAGTRRNDVGIFYVNFSRVKAFCVIEAKRLSENDHSNQYVCGERGGIERFKRNVHGAGLDYSIMIGYIQKENESHWFERVNNKIESLAETNGDDQIDWSVNDKLKKTKQDLMHYEYESKHRRKGIKPIMLMHYWVQV